jgi:hypothetical protein
MSILGWWIGACSGLSLTSTTILGLTHFMHPNFEIKQWHEYCIYLATLVATSNFDLPNATLLFYDSLLILHDSYSTTCHPLPSTNAATHFMGTLLNIIWISHMVCGTSRDTQAHQYRSNSI